MSRQPPTVLICAGGGGVGKTTAAAAIAVALARTGARTLVVTVDPARRLAQAMGVDIDSEVHTAELEPEVAGRLHALMPEPGRSTRIFVELLFHDQPDALERLLHNRIYSTFDDALAGIHDLVSLMLIARAADEGDYDYLVVDTAPSRFALDLLSYPRRLAELFESRAMAWFSRLAHRAQLEDGDPPADESKLIAWARRRVEAIIGLVLEPQMLRDVAGMSAELLLVRHRFAALARTSDRLLLGDRARYLLVSSPSGAALADVRFLAAKLATLQQQPAAIIVNRADPMAPEWLTRLRATAQLSAPLPEALERIAADQLARQRAGEEMAQQLERELAPARALRLPTIEARDPTAIVRALADELEDQLPALGVMVG